MHSLRKKRVAISLVWVWAMTMPLELSAAAVHDHTALPISELTPVPETIRVPMAIFLNGDRMISPGVAAPHSTENFSSDQIRQAFEHASSSNALPAASGVSASSTYQDWVAVDSTVLDTMRGGFDLAPGLKVSIGIERIVNLNGILQTATRIEVPDAAKLIQAQQSAGANPGQSNVLPINLANPGSPHSTPANNGAPGETVSLPAATNLGGGATALIQNGMGNLVAAGALSPEAAAMVIQNSVSNQTIQSVTVINAATNSLELLKDANLQSTLLDALTQSAGTR